MKFYTLKQFNQDNKTLLENGATDAQLFRLRTVWRLASYDYKLARVSLKRLEQAKRLYNAVRKNWKTRDNYLEFDSIHDHETAKYYSNKEDKELLKIKELCKPLKLTCICSTWSHIYADTNKSEIM